MNGRRYCLVSPCRDEAALLERTLSSVAAQSELPARWVVVDDGSTDETPQLLRAWAEQLPFLQVITRPDRGERKVGPGVIEAFYAGFATLELRDYDYVCKLDLDLELPPTYFATLMDEMQSRPRLGTFSGKPYMELHGQLVSEKCGDENSVGMTKFYRVECFRQIGGFVREVMWDGIDGHRCRMLGWIAASEDRPELRFLHLRPMGSSQKSWWTGRMRHGFGQWFMGTSPLYMAASAIFRATRPPLLLGGLAMAAGYLRSALRRDPRYPDLEFRRFLRSYQWSCLWRGKARTTARFDRESEARWQADRARSSGTTPSDPI